MPDADALIVRSALERELSWRWDEVRRLRNLQSSDAAKREEVATALRRALLVLLYAHVEGFAKFAFEQYADAVNKAKLPVGKARNPLAAACLLERFKSYRATSISDPHDPAGNRMRQVLKDAEFVAEVLDLQNNTIVLDLEKVTSSDSNLSSSVLRRNMTLLALDDTDIHKFTSALDGLLKLRNGIAHGENVNLKSDPTFVKLEGRVRDLCDSLTRMIYQAVRDELYRR
ncbi:MAE_28990/MAE_18760 family HEPN-like nuclease [Streptomyces sp. NPDC090301]|uniref:MAE_28990/MAE_18760 family HEPN-like nuclease n=1 Tax=Streptomyces sp. NPDC090301 TaxID=3154975 RepID=UPI0034368F59